MKTRGLDEIIKKRRSIEKINLCKSV